MDASTELSTTNDRHRRSQSLPAFAGLPKTPDGATLWVTRARPKIDRIACPWLILRFIDPSAKFLFVRAEDVRRVAHEQGATAFDIPDAQFSHVGEQCSFDAFIDAFELHDDPGLRGLAPIVRGADTSHPEMAPQAAGLLAISLGLSRLFERDDDMLRHGLTVYDSLYLWARDGTAETHNWNPKPPQAATTDAPLLLARGDVKELLPIDDCIDAVEKAFIAAALGRAPQPRSLGFPSGDGGFHVKVASLSLNRSYFAAKLNGNFPTNAARFGLPTIQGLILLSDALNGQPLAVLDSIEITILRTGAATAVAARRLARDGASTVTILGCGNQGRVSLEALSRVRPLSRVFLWDIDAAAAERLALESRQAFGSTIAIEVVTDRGEATRKSEIVVTCTPSREPILEPWDVSSGAFIAAVGADSESKHEISVKLFSRAKVVTDDAEQCSRIGDLHHAVEAGAMQRESVHANLGEILSGAKRGRESEDEIIVFDSTGTALQDVAVSALVYERALASGRGTPFRFA